LPEINVTGYREVGGINYPIFGIGHGDDSNDFYGYAGGMSDWQFGFESANPPNEEFADMFVGWTYNTWGRRVGNTSSLAYQCMQHMATFMPDYLLGR
jgi:hypothetical protein